MDYTFSRKGDCACCGGSGTIWKYSHNNGGKCYQCNGTGGVRPPKNCYKVFLDVDDTEMFLGYVQQVQRERWRPIPARQREIVETMYKTRKDAADALRGRR